MFFSLLTNSKSVESSKVASVNMVYHLNISCFDAIYVYSYPYSDRDRYNSSVTSGRVKGHIRIVSGMGVHSTGSSY